MPHEADKGKGKYDGGSMNLGGAKKASKGGMKKATRSSDNKKSSSRQNY